jgi:pimeloyl-ACP methyl ester carboxylesterase
VSLGGAAAMPLAARAQERYGGVGMLSGIAAGDPSMKSRHEAFLQEMAQLGWVDGHNMRIDAYPNFEPPGHARGGMGVSFPWISMRAAISKSVSATGLATPCTN